MYYPQQSPGMAHKLPNHHDQSPWTRGHHPVLGPPGSQSNVGPPPTSPGYAIYTNGGVNTMQHHGGHHPHALAGHATLQHHHQNSLSHYPSPPNGHSLQHTLGSPASQPNQAIITPHWQQQLMKYDMIRVSSAPHTRARASAMASRTVTRSAIPITNPNAIKSPPKEEATIADGAGTAAPMDHPSSIVGPVAELPRITTARSTESSWSSLDMGGVRITNIPPTSGLFSFTFLINLYLNHNSLTFIPPEISKLRHLELLDLSGNQLSTLPPALGMLTNLKELYLFDNKLSVIPRELGSLHQLQTFGIEGNPEFEPSLKAILQQNGTTALISWLRDKCDPPDPPDGRAWIQLLSAAEKQSMEEDGTETFRVLSYNILCERCATEKLYGYTPSWALVWDYRKKLIMAEILTSQADFLCLQEVDIAQYEGYFLKQLAKHDYEGVFWPKARYKTMSDTDRKQVDGCAIFYNASKHQLVEKQLVEFSQIAMQRQDFKKTDDMFNRVLGKDHMAVVCSLENKQSGSRVIIANAHIYWNAAFSDVKLVQVALLTDELEKIAASFAKYPPRPPRAAAPSENANGTSTSTVTRPPPVYTDGSRIPMIICGDFNSIPSSGVYEFLSTGSLPANHPEFMSHTYGRYTSEGLKHRLGLKSAYAGVGELPMTNFTPSFQGAIDYLFYSTANLAVNAVLGEVDRNYLTKVVGFPNVHFPSDHLCLLSEFRIKPPKEIATRGSAPNHS